MVYILLLRGINVGANNRVPMKQLEQRLKELGFERSMTYIQSGNILIDTDMSAQACKSWFVELLHEEFHVSVPVLIRTAEELAAIVTDTPFPTEDGTRLNVSFMERALTQEETAHLSKFQDLPDRYALHGKDVYLYLGQSVRDSKLALYLPKVGDSSTIRNWNTTVKLLELARNL